MRIERPDPAVAALQLMARIPASEPAVSQAKMAQNAGLDAERGSQNTYSNLLRARLHRLEKLKVITETAGKYALMLHGIAQDDSQEEMTAGVAGEAAQSLVELLMEANGEGPPIFPPLPSPLARSRRSLAGYLKQIPDQLPPPPKSLESVAVEATSELLTRQGGILGTLQSLAKEPLKEEMKEKLLDLAREALEVSEMTSDAMTQMNSALKQRPSLEARLESLA